MKKIYFILCSLGFFLQLIAQPSVDDNYNQQLPGERAKSNVRGAIYPRLLSNNQAIFKVKAPTANNVQLQIDKTYDMKLDDNGIWSCTTEPLSEGFHYYSLLIDGANVADPASESFYGCGMMSSGIEVPYPNDRQCFSVSDVPHGAVRMNRYFSKSNNAWKRMFVYTPPGYDNNDKSYPVMYLLHGGGEDERGWVNQGKTDIIIDNLIAKNEVTPMIIAMIDGNTKDIEKAILDEYIPYIENNYRAIKEKEGRALAGLSMGGIQTLNVGILHPELFSYLGVFSSGWWATPPIGYSADNMAEKYYSLLQKEHNKYNKEFKQFWISMGGKEDIAYNNCQIMMKRFDEIGINYTYFEIPGGHTWPVWRESLLEFAPLLFKQ